MKKILILLVAIIMAISVSACGKEENVEYGEIDENISTEDQFVPVKPTDYIDTLTRVSLKDKVEVVDSKTGYILCDYFDLNQEDKVFETKIHGKVTDSKQISLKITVYNRGEEIVEEYTKTIKSHMANGTYKEVCRFEISNPKTNSRNIGKIVIEKIDKTKGK